MTRGKKEEVGLPAGSLVVIQWAGGGGGLCQVAEREFLRVGKELDFVGSLCGYNANASLSVALTNGSR